MSGDARAALRELVDSLGYMGSGSGLEEVIEVWGRHEDAYWGDVPMDRLYRALVAADAALAEDEAREPA